MFDWFFSPEYASFLAKVLIAFGVFIILVLFVIPRFFPGIQYKLEQFRYRNKGNKDEE